MDPWLEIGGSIIDANSILLPTKFIENCFKDFSFPQMQSAHKGLL